MGIVQGLVQTVLSEGKIEGKVEFHLQGRRYVGGCAVQ